MARMRPTPNLAHTSHGSCSHRSSTEGPSGKVRMRRTLIWLIPHTVRGPIGSSSEGREEVSGGSFRDVSPLASSH
eukprot:6102533-Pyramimonas_sp.AAC.1